ncbi:MAG: hypothetical protein ACYDAR_03070 [Thermomicrobiales bacterium]
MMKRMHKRLSRAGAVLTSFAFVLLPLLTAVVSVAPQSVSAAAPVSGTTVVGLPNHVNVKMTGTPPVLTAAEQARLDAGTKNSNKPGVTEPVGPNATVKNGPPSVPSYPPTPNGKQKASDFNLFQAHAYGATIPAMGYRSQVPENDAAGTTDEIMATGNWWAAISTNRGASFSFINPYSQFPSISGGFCCDQKILYDQSRGIFIWELQYLTPAEAMTGTSNSNTDRFAVATHANAAIGSWYTYDINGATAGYPTSPDVELDYPNMALDNGFLVYTANTFFGGATSSSTSTAFRLSLDTLAAHGSLTVAFFNGGFGMTPSQGFGSTIYLVNHANTTQLRLYTWSDASGAPSGPILLLNSAYVTTQHHCVSPDATDACRRDDTRIKNVFQTFGFLFVVWDVGEGTGGLGTFTMPYVHIAQYNLTTDALVQEPIISDPSTAYAFASFSPNGRGNVGGNIVYSGGSFYPGSAFIIADDFTSGVQWNFNYLGSGTNGPGILRWGDYTDVHAVGGNGNIWLANTYDVEGGTCPTNSNRCDNVVNRFYMFGRERDNPFFGKQALPAIFRNVGGSGVFYERNSFSSGAPNITAVFGAGTDQGMMCDFNGDGSKTPAVYRTSAGAVFWSNSYDGSTFDGGVAYGAPGDIGVCGDWTGSGHDGFGVFRPSTGVFYLTNNVSSGIVNFTIVFGTAGDKAVVGSWNSTGPAKVGVFRNGVFYLASSNTTFPTVAFAFPFGAPGDLPIAGDWDRNGSTTVGVYRPSAGAFFYSNDVAGTFSGAIVYGGAPGDVGIIWQ